MQISLRSTTGSMNYIGQNERGHTIQLSGSKEAVGPMESVLMAAAGCSAIDIELILLKMKQELKHLEVKVDGERDTENVPAIFISIHLHYTLTGQIKDEKAKKAVDVSVKKYCSVLTMLEKSAKISYSYEVIDA